MDLFGLKAHLAGHHGVVGVTVRAVVAACREDTVQRGSSGEDEIQLVPVAGPGVSPGHSAVWFCGEECVGCTEVMEGA